MAQVHVALGKVASLHEELPRAEEELRLAAAAFRTDPAYAHQLAVALNNLGLLAVGRGDFDDAMSAYDEALRTSTKAEGEEPPAVARTRHLMCQALGERGDVPATREQCAIAVAVLENASSRERGDVLKTWSYLERDAGNAREAARLAAKALESYGPDAKVSSSDRRHLEALAAGP